MQQSVLSTLCANVALHWAADGHALGLALAARQAVSIASLLYIKSAYWAAMLVWGRAAC